MNIDLYNSFIRNLHVTVPKTATDEILEPAFHRVNGQFFSGFIEQPNLVWGNPNTHKLATYDYKNDTITVSSHFREAPQEMLDYLLYHELLHKKFKFSSTGTKTLHHSAAFRKAERLYPEFVGMDKRISQWLRQKGKRSLLPW